MSENKVKEEKKLSAKIISIVCMALTGILVALTCYVLISLIVAKTQNKPVNIFGYSFAVVMTDSMEPEIMTGDMIVFRRCDISEVEELDNIVFIAGDGFDAVVRGQSVVHKAINVTEYGIQTKGVNNPVADKDLVTADNFLGICTFHSAALGFLRYGYLLLVAFIGIPVIALLAVKIVKLAKQAAAEKKELSSNSSEDSEDKNEDQQ